jgi:hypothetical protein
MASAIPCSLTLPLTQQILIAGNLYVYQSKTHNCHHKFA